MEYIQCMYCILCTVKHPYPIIVSPVYTRWQHCARLTPDDIHAAAIMKPHRGSFASVTHRAAFVWILKLRFHLSVMWMQMRNVNAKKIEKTELAGELEGVFSHKSKCFIRQEIASYAASRRVAHSTWRENYTGSLIAFGIHSDCAQVECWFNCLCQSMLLRWV